MNRYCRHAVALHDTSLIFFGNIEHAVVLHGTSLIFGLGVRQHRARCCTAWHKPAIWIRRSAKERQKKKEEEEEEEEEEEATIDVLDHS